ncbi:hypothetical protein CR513_12037, partial [Mucuna pruriens]
MQALTSHLEKLFDRKLEETHKRMDQMRNQIVINKLLQTTQGEINNPTKEMKANLRRRRIMKKNNQEGEGLIQMIKGDIEIEERMILEELKLKSIHLKAKDQMQKEMARYGECHLQHLSQGSKSVDDYHKEIEMTMIRVNILEDQEVTMTRFLNRLNHDIIGVVEMY